MGVSIHVLFSTLAPRKLMRELMRSRDWESWICGPLKITIGGPNLDIVNMFQLLLNQWTSHVFSYAVCTWNLCEKFIRIAFILNNIHCCSSPDVDVEELESLRTRKSELEDSISDLDSSLKVLQSEQRRIEDEAAKLQRERVSQMTENCNYQC